MKPKRIVLAGGSGFIGTALAKALVARKYEVVVLTRSPRERSDGVTEAMDPEDEMFGMTRLAEVLQDKSDVPLEHLQKCVLESVENFVRGARQADDVTMLLVRYQATAKDAISDTDAPSASSAVA